MGERIKSHMICAAALREAAPSTSADDPMKSFSVLLKVNPNLGLGF
jgi:hypothetical protein